MVLDLFLPQLLPDIHSCLTLSHAFGRTVNTVVSHSLPTKDHSYTGEAEKSTLIAVTLPTTSPYHKKYRQWYRLQTNSPTSKCNCKANTRSCTSKSTSHIFTKKVQVFSDASATCEFDITSTERVSSYLSYADFALSLGCSRTTGN